MAKLLSFKNGNAKLPAYITNFSLPAGHTCPFARDCQSKACTKTGKIIDGPNCIYRCYAASMEVVFPNVRKHRWDNFNLLKESKNQDGLIAESLPDSVIVRMHVSGDFFSQAYFDAWLSVARANPEVRFYGYTKALPYWVKRLNKIPSNFGLVASRGGTHDFLIKEYRLPHCEVVYTEAEAKRKGMEIDHDDSHAIRYRKPFALLLHGVQPAGFKGYSHRDNARAYSRN